MLASEVDQVLVTAAQTGDRSTLAPLTKRGGRLTYVRLRHWDKANPSPLHIAIERGHSAVIESLLKLGASPLLTTPVSLAPHYRTEISAISLANAKLDAKALRPLLKAALNVEMGRDRIIQQCNKSTAYVAYGFCQTRDIEKLREIVAVIDEIIPESLPTLIENLASESFDFNKAPQLVDYPTLKKTYSDYFEQLNALEVIGIPLPEKATKIAQHLAMWLIHETTLQHQPAKAPPIP